MTRYVALFIPLAIGVSLLLLPRIFTGATGDAFDRRKKRLRGIGILLLGVAAAYFLVAFKGSIRTEGSAVPRTVMHRTQAQTRDSSDWYLAESTGGSFSVLVPVPFNDFTIFSEDPQNEAPKVECIAAPTPEGLKFSVAEMPVIIGGKLADINEIPQQFQNQGKKVSEIQKLASPGLLSVTFTTEGPVSGALVRYIQSSSNLITMILEYPIARRSDATALKSRFFESLKSKAVASSINTNTEISPK